MTDLYTNIYLIYIYTYIHTSLDGEDQFLCSNPKHVYVAVNDGVASRGDACDYASGM